MMDAGDEHNPNVDAYTDGGINMLAMVQAYQKTANLPTMSQETEQTHCAYQMVVSSH